MTDPTPINFKVSGYTNVNLNPDKTIKFASKATFHKDVELVKKSDASKKDAEPNLSVGGDLTVGGAYPGQTP